MKYHIKFANSIKTHEEYLDITENNNRLKLKSQAQNSRKALSVAI